MLNKQSTIRQLLDSSIVKWFNTTINEKAKSAVTDLAQISEEAPLLAGMGGSEIEIETEVASILEDIKYLRTVEEIRIYCDKNGFNSEDVMFKDNQLSMDTMAQFLTSGDSIIKMLLKVQFGGTFATAIQVINKADSIAAKLGTDTTLGDIEEEDAIYLLNKTLDQWISEIKTFAVTSDDMESILVELNKIEISKAFDIKTKAIANINTHLTQFKAADVFDSLSDGSNINKAEEDEIVKYSKALGAVNSLQMLINLADEIIIEFISIQN